MGEIIFWCATCIAIIIIGHTIQTVFVYFLWWLLTCAFDMQPPTIIGSFVIGVVIVLGEKFFIGSRKEK
jgi:hypothetical protein